MAAASSSPRLCASLQAVGSLLSHKKDNRPMKPISAIINLGMFQRRILCIRLICSTAYYALDSCSIDSCNMQKTKGRHTVQSRLTAMRSSFDSRIRCLLAHVAGRSYESNMDDMDFGILNPKRAPIIFTDVFLGWDSGPLQGRAPSHGMPSLLEKF